MNSFKIGDRVVHIRKQKFGVGTVVRVNTRRLGIRWDGYTKYIGFDDMHSVSDIDSIKHTKEHYVNCFISDNL